jgi:DNA-binding response OmpR family regulator
MHLTKQQEAIYNVLLAANGEWVSVEQIEDTIDPHGLETPAVKVQICYIRRELKEAGLGHKIETFIKRPTAPGEKASYRLVKHDQAA